MKVIAKQRDALTLDCPAKVNLFLSVKGKRRDGYHDLINVMQKVTLFDRVVLEKKSSPGIDLWCSREDIPPEKNLVFLAARSFFERASLEARLKISLTKKIPVGGGLGGGSSDAAGVLRGLNILFGCPLGFPDLKSVADDLGSDVPFFLRKGTWVMEGKGDTFSRCIKSRTFYFLLFFFGHKSHTKSVYEKHLSSGRKDLCSLSRFSASLRRGRGSRVRKEMKNDLLPAFFSAYPKQRQIYIDLKKKMCKNLFLSGSGATFFSIFDTRSAMTEAFSSLHPSIQQHVFQAKSFLE